MNSLDLLIALGQQNDEAFSRAQSSLDEAIQILKGMGGNND